MINHVVLKHSPGYLMQRAEMAGTWALNLVLVKVQNTTVSI